MTCEKNNKINQLGPLSGPFFFVHVDPCGTGKYFIL